MSSPPWMQRMIILAVVLWGEVVFCESHATESVSNDVAFSFDVGELWHNMFRVKILVLVDQILVVSEYLNLMS